MQTCFLIYLPLTLRFNYFANLCYFVSLISFLLSFLDSLQEACLSTANFDYRKTAVFLSGFFLLILPRDLDFVQLEFRELEIHFCLGAFEKQIFDKDFDIQLVFVKGGFDTDYFTEIIEVLDGILDWSACDKPADLGA